MASRGFRELEAEYLTEFILFVGSKGEFCLYGLGCRQILVLAPVGSAAAFSRRLIN